MFTLHRGCSFGKAFMWNSKNDIWDKNVILIIKEYYDAKIFLENIAFINGIITKDKNETSHCVIIAKAYNIPIISVEDIDIKNIKEGDSIFINSDNSLLINIENEQQLVEAEKQYNIYIKEKEKLNSLKNSKLINFNNKEVKILSNIVIREEVNRAIDLGAEGIGVFRTEFFFINRESLPNEEEQLKEYKYVVEKMKNKLVVIRTLDIGGDKSIEYLNIEKEENPFLGNRGIRYCLSNLDIFKTQIKAILRASLYGNVCLLLPMITTVNEIINSKLIIEQCKKELIEEGKGFGDVKIGIMVEVPIVAFEIQKYIKYVDHLSIGTNDLIQYTYAIDRTNNKVSNIYYDDSEMILDLIYKVITIAEDNNISCSICGEMASDPQMVKKLIDLGVTELSVASSLILETKKQLIDIL